MTRKDFANIAWVLRQNALAILVGDWQREHDAMVRSTLRALGDDRFDTAPAVSQSTDGDHSSANAIAGCFDADGILRCGWPDKHRQCEICGHDRSCHNPFMHDPEGCHVAECQCLDFSGYVPPNNAPNGWHWGSECGLSTKGNDSVR